MNNLINLDPPDEQINRFGDNDLVCHCFNYTRKQIEKDYMDNGRSMILRKIMREKKTGGCDCADKNPKGR